MKFSNIRLIRYSCIFIIGTVFFSSVSIISPELRYYMVISLYLPFFFIFWVTFPKFQGVRGNLSLFFLKAFVFSSFLSVILGANLYDGAHYFIRGPLLLMLMILSLIIYFRKESPMKILLVYLFFSTILCLLSFLINYNFISVVYYDAGVEGADLIGYSRFTGVYSNPNSLGLLFSLEVALVLFFLSYKHNWKVKWFFFGVLGLSILGCFLTVSRASITMALLEILVYLSLGGTKNFFYSMVALVILLMISTQVLDYQFIMERFTGDSLNGREEIWDKAFMVISENPFFGYGLGQFFYEDSLGRRFSAHNYYLQMCADSGYFTLVFFVFFLLSLVLRASYSIFILHSKDIFMRFSLAFCFGLYFHQFFETSGFNMYGIQGLVFSACAAYMCGNYANKAESL